MDDLFQTLTAPHSLTLAFAKVEVNKGCAGGDGQSIAAFRRRLPGAIELLSGKLRSGSYRPRALRRHGIDKPGGGVRTLTIPSVSDRVVQTAAAQLLGPILEPTFSDASYGYRPGRSVQMAVDRVSALRGSGYHWVLEADIRTAFDMIPHDAVLEALEEVLGDKPGAAEVVVADRTGDAPPDHRRGIEAEHRAVPAQPGHVPVHVDGDAVHLHRHLADPVTHVRGPVAVDLIDPGPDERFDGGAE